jgi:hypothetical protein
MYADYLVEIDLATRGNLANGVRKERIITSAGNQIGRQASTSQLPDCVLSWLSLFLAMNPEVC